MGNLMTSRKLRAQAIAILAYIALCTPASFAADAATIGFAQQVKAALSRADQSWLAEEARATLAGNSISAAAVLQEVSTHFAARNFSKVTVEALVLTTLVEVESQAAAAQSPIKEAMRLSGEAREAIKANGRLSAALHCLSDANQRMFEEFQRVALNAMEAAAQASAIQKKYNDALQQIIDDIRA
jgi:hypothetical protein